MDIKRINENVSVCGQISIADVADIKAAGFVAIVNNRPDGEAADQTPSAEIEAATAAAGLSFKFIPMGREGVSAEMIAQTRSVMDEAAGPVFCYCRTGTRSTTLWAFSESGRKSAQDIIAAALNAGYDMSHLAGHLE